MTKQIMSFENWLDKRYNDLREGYRDYLTDMLSENADIEETRSFGEWAREEYVLKVDEIEKKELKEYFCPKCDSKIDYNYVSPDYYGACLNCDEDFYECELKIIDMVGDDDNDDDDEKHIEENTQFFDFTSISEIIYTEVRIGKNVKGEEENYLEIRFIDNYDRKWTGSIEKLYPNSGIDVFIY